MQPNIRRASARKAILSPFMAIAISGICACDTGLGQQTIEKKIAARADNIFAELVEIRRDFHRHPELSGSESRTASIVAAQLKSYGLDVRSSVGGHGVVGILGGSGKGPVVAYRADTDALPMDIKENVPFKSATPGIGHACGHDVHLAVGLGIAKVLSSLKEELPGTVVFIFQPSEENVEGAKRMIAEGVLGDPSPEAIFAIHVTPFEKGIVVTNPGVGLPGMERFTIRLRGVNSLEAAGKALVDSIRAIGTVHYPNKPEEWDRSMRIPLERNGPYSSFVLAQAWAEKASSGEGRVIKGFFKASGEREYSRARALTQRALSGFEKQGILTEIEFDKFLPDMFCDKELAEWAVGPLQAILGEHSVLYAYSSIPFFGEDFAFFLERIPGVMFFLGASNSEKDIHALPHSPTFGVDEEAILVGVKGMSNIIARYLLNQLPSRGDGL